MDSTTPDVDYLELQLAANLTRLLEGLPIGAQFDVQPAADLCSTLERFLPRELVPQHPEWRGQGIDGFFIASAKKTGPGTAEFLGLCILIRDQRVTPFFVELELAGPSGGLNVRQLNLGEPGTGALGISGPAVHSGAARKLLDRLPYRRDNIEWTYILTKPARGA